MANNKSFVVLIFVLCLNLISTNIYAANVGGWTLGGGVAQGASTVYEGTKKVVIDGVDYIKKGTAKITPPASSVAKVLARGAAGYALSIAVEQLLGAVSWVLDAENNRILYTELSPLCGATAKFCYTTAGGIKAGTPQEACKQLNAKNGTKYHSASETTCYYDVGGNPAPLTSITKVPNVDYDASAEQEQKSIPLTTVAQKVISNAESGDARAQAATTAAAADIVAEAEKDEAKARPIAQQLESSSTTKPADEAAAEKANEATGTQTQNPAKPDTTDLKLEFPIFCNWAPTVCEAAQVVISFPQTLTDWWNTGKTKAEEWALSISEAWTAAKEWATKEKDSEDTEVDIEELDLEAESVDINLVSGCPAPVVFIDSDFYGQPFKIEFSFDGFCSILSDWVRPILISLGAFIAALILGGVKVNE